MFQPHCKGAGETATQVGSPGSRNTRTRDVTGVCRWIKGDRREDLPLPFVPPRLRFPVDPRSLPPTFRPSKPFLPNLLSVSWLTGPTPQEKQGAERGNQTLGRNC